ncbi:ribonucleases P/MRP protein subunit POP1 [Uranotaenia lowii]|uniref:ribonucleases P/MRP protein subunit POP1 n=1 Tax=Uranotaenia lowii TaxID=190385 RepID=UPI00247833E3|nr:ribonucleases P/MRP protein subunit POP1 [Uranotaenia lowii]
MESATMQYDAAAGGTVKLPGEIDSLQFNNERLLEIKAMLRSLASTENQTKLMHQSLPLHMRRRAMSYNPKRLPRKFRYTHIAQYSKSGLPEKKKRPSRKYRRKASNLLKEYERRQKSNIWLETHIWHAKRFHMTSKWGYKIPLTATSKSYRASYRATSKHCLLQDLSYYGCIELTGDESILRQELQRICSDKVGLTMVAKAYMSGVRAGQVWLFQIDQYPLHCLGQIKFLWKPQTTTQEKRTVWLFAHPVFYNSLVNELKKLFALKNAHYKGESMEGAEIKAPSSIRIPTYENLDIEVRLRELKDTLNCFRLTGPLANSVLRAAIKHYIPLEPEQSKPKHWFADWRQCTSNHELHSKQALFYGQAMQLPSSSNFSPGCIISVTMEEPRLNRPKRRTKALPPLVLEPVTLPPLDPSVANSPLWEQSIRDSVTNNMVTTHVLNQKRNEQALVPGERCAFERSCQPVPIILIQNPGSQDSDFKRLGYGAGWDLIAPSGYGLALWQTFIMWGAKPAGLKEFDLLAIESGRDISRIPDTILGKFSADDEHTNSWKKYFSRPNNRRINYTKLSIASPFRCPWSKLISEWNDCSEDDASSFFVLRDQEILNKIHLCLNRKFNVQSLQLPKNCLIPIFLTMKARGSLDSNSIICLPDRKDFRQNKTQNQLGDSTPVYTEPLRKDPRSKERHRLRQMHLRFLKTLRNRRVRAKKIQQRAHPGKLIRISRPQNDKLISEQLTKMQELWLPAEPETVRNQCSRECFGYITQSSFSLSEANVAALGYITGRGLRKLFKICIKGTFKVLVRSTKSRSYRFANFKVRLE